MRRLPAVAALGCALWLSGCGDKANVREPTPLQPLEATEVQPSLVWERHLGRSGGQATDLRMVAEFDALFLADRQGRVYALDPQSGDTLWTQKVAGNLQAGPSVAGDAVLVGSRDAKLLSLSRANGELQWTATVSSEVLGAPVGDGSVVVVRSIDGAVYGLSAATGSERWSYGRGAPTLMLRGLSAPLIVGSSVIVGQESGRVVSLASYDGKLRWEQPLSLPQGRTELDRLTDIDGDLIDGLRCILAASFGGQVACFELSTGRVLWRRDVKTYLSPAYSDGKLYVTDESSLVVALDEASGAIAWTQDAFKYRGLSAPAVVGEQLVVGDEDGYLHWLDRRDGRIVGRDQLGGAAIVELLATDDGLLYVRNRKGAVYAVRSEPGEGGAASGSRAVRRRGAVGG